MQGKEIINILTTAIPESDTYVDSEPYGAFGVDLEANYKKLLFCVTPTKDVIKYFHDNNYDLLISHHAFQADVPQIILHTALDCCKAD